MAGVNKVFLWGNLTRDPELRFTSSGSAVCDLGLAVNRKYKVGDEWKEEVTFANITVWGKQGENCAEYLNKGSSALVEGRLRFSSWEDEDGKTRSKLDVTAENVQFTDKKGEKNETSGSGDIPF